MFNELEKAKINVEQLGKESASERKKELKKINKNEHNFPKPVAENSSNFIAIKVPTEGTIYLDQKRIWSADNYYCSGIVYIHFDTVRRFENYP